MIPALFTTDFELLVCAGFLYLPLPMDRRVAEELDGRDPLPWAGAAAPDPDPPPPLLTVGGRRFVQSLALSSLRRGYRQLYSEHWRELRRRLLVAEPVEPDSAGAPPVSDRRFQVVVLEVLPHFVATGDPLGRRRLAAVELLDWVGRRIGLPQRDLDEAAERLDSKALLRRLRQLDQCKLVEAPMPRGLIAPRELQAWLETVVSADFLAEERRRLEQLRAELRPADPQTLRLHALKLYLERTGTLEIDGFGLTRCGAGGDFYVYKRTGAYVLRDYYGRGYRFGDCRVAVPAAGPYRPLVLDHYKHPFLPGHAARQEICLPANYARPDRFTAAGVIRLLEDAIHALLYGYDPRRRNGYHSLDPSFQYVEDIDFADCRL